MIDHTGDTELAFVVEAEGLLLQGHALWQSDRIGKRRHDWQLG